ncbi:MAG: hypothetical protein CFE21_00500 [Bacteroidetes bacterium B1(2017)]|nr:MAG: hypothetical protein CFE21_00500 [Bacteroidetes bacterium B1(2017)]
MGKPSFSKADQALIVSAIQAAEKESSGEIRVHVEPTCKLDPIERAKEVFYQLKMNSTELKNGVLIYVATEDRKIAILGDSGIHDRVGDNFWKEELEGMRNHFGSGNYAAGLSEAILHVGLKLKAHFPYQSNDTNELSNEISFGEGTKHE